jgi:uncharacterized flavoprotein (TIGR03862 family)
VETADTQPVAVTGHAVVVGGGPAGLMAAEVLTAAGLAVTVYDHMPSVGRKFLLAGRGGLNITHSEPFDMLLGRYRTAVPLVEASLRQFGPAELRDWCAALGEPTFVGPTGRVFPKSFRATPLLRSWLSRLLAAGVTIETRHRWQRWSTADNGQIDPHRLVFSNEFGEQIEVHSDVTVMALGGASWPRVGSDGGWVAAFVQAGVRISDLRPSNCAVNVVWTSGFAARFAGTPLKNVAITVAAETIRGGAMITTDGLEGGPIYAHSAAIHGELDRDGRCLVTVDLQPDLSEQQLRRRLDQRRPKDSVANALRRTLGLPAASAALLREMTANCIPTDAAELARLVKAVPVRVESLAAIDRAISTAGGIALSEIDGSFMLRRLPGTFVAGEMLDWDAPTGGYLLQASFSTGVAAARGAAAWLNTSA